MKRTRTLRIWGGFWLLLLLLFTFLIWNIFAGSVSLSASEIWRILLGGDVDFTQSQIIMKIRLPRLLSALILGGALSLSGYLLQVNPFNQPGVEAYKNNMYALLGKPGYESQRAELEKRL